MVVRSLSGDVRAFPVVQTIHCDSILSVTEAPANVPTPLLDRAQQLAASAVSCLEGVHPRNMHAIAHVDQAVCPLYHGAAPLLAEHAARRAVIHELFACWKFYVYISTCLTRLLGPWGWPGRQPGPPRHARCSAGAGVFGVEMFALQDGKLLVNEVAPRPHNSGHYTIEACAASQFEQHLRAVLGWPLASTELIVGARCARVLVCLACAR